MAKSAPPAIELDQRQVLAHLNYLGYHNITGLQLKEFMKDLKKLIRHDQMKSKQNSNPCHSSQTFQKKKHPTHASDQPSENDRKLTSEKRSSSLTSKSTLTKSASITSSNSHLDKPPLRTVQAKSSTSSITAPPTYIRPWNIRSCAQKFKTGTTSDPVALYQHYKELWKLQPLPGENDRAELRWQIRKKLNECHPPPKTSADIRESRTTEIPMSEKLSFVDDPCNHPPYYVPQYKKDLESLSYWRPKRHYTRRVDDASTWGGTCGSSLNGRRMESVPPNNRSSHWHQELQTSSVPNTQYTDKINTEHGKRCGLKTRKSQRKMKGKCESKLRVKQKSKGQGGSKASFKGGSKVAKDLKRTQGKSIKYEMECEDLGFHQVQIPLETSLEEVVKEYAVPLARQMQHDDVYISTRFSSHFHPKGADLLVVAGPE